MAKNFVKNNFNDFNARPVSFITENFFFLKKIFLLCLISVKKSTENYKRTKNQVLKDYNDTVWEKIKSDKSWGKSSNLIEFILPEEINGVNRKNKFGKFLLGSKLCVMTEFDYYKFRHKILSDTITKYISSDDELVELGCGYGFNLFSLRSAKVMNKMQGFDLSTNAVLAGNEISQHFHEDIKFEVRDMIDLANVDLKNKTVFSYYSFEQVKYDTPRIIKNIVDLKPKQVVHIEPVIELYGKSFRDIASSIYIKTQDYQDNLLTTLRSFEDKRILKVHEVRRLGYAANPLHEASLIRWAPI